MILALEALGLTPEDVVITEVGGQAARIAALQGGPAPPRRSTPPDTQRWHELGLQLLVNLKEASSPGAAPG